MKFRYIISFILISVMLCSVLVSCDTSTTPQNNNEPQENQQTLWEKKLDSLGILVEGNENIILSNIPNIKVLDKTDTSNVFLARDESLNEFLVIADNSGKIVKITTNNTIPSFRTTIYPEPSTLLFQPINGSKLIDDWLFFLAGDRDNTNHSNELVEVDLSDMVFEWYYFPNVNKDSHLGYIFDNSYQEKVIVDFTYADSGVHEEALTYDWFFNCPTVRGIVSQYNTAGITIHVKEIVTNTNF